ncbi:MAG: hypothetical protein ACRD4U_01515 [Candidatus Acidiferrales bacterium]
MSTTIPNPAKAYAGLVTLTGATVLALGLLHWQSQDLTAYLAFFFLALVGSVLKIRLPGFTGTMSLSFVFILIAVADFSFSETVALGCAAAMAQSLWKPQQLKALQIIFNVAAITLSSAVAYWGSHSLLNVMGASSLPILMALAACLYLVANTLVVAIVISLTEAQALMKVWKQCYRWAFPYFAAGAAVAGLVCASCKTVGWQVSLLVLPAAYLLYVYYRMHADCAEVKA